ncbi:NnrS family protein [Sphingomonas parapaucimobilis]|uniref:NnrS family protein n=1 Tax=Sphingomonas parapaucimobilis NBRC 15100 TaxID=1219049 RepID=A0A0A1WA31_9SPHN|nr:NnrS family protein [Sphingomonas parapaucimobilis]GAM01836.1 hypothetical protein SP5_069_00800 [Sphingomonas parapaucimobilis NBRC 15100]
MQLRLHPADPDAPSARRRRLTASPPLLRGGFRPFFLAGALWAVIVLLLFLCALAGQITLPSRFDPVTWHRHEMLFGYIGAVIAAFLLTAIPNWTGRLPISGAPLAALVGLWAAARGAILFSAWVSAPLAALLGTGFLLALAACCGREVLIARNRNLPMIALVLLLALADGLDHAEALGVALPAGLGYRLAIALVTTMLGLIGGRIIPSFTRNWLARQPQPGRLPGQPTRFDQLVLLLSAAAMLAWTAAPSAAATGWLLLLAGAGQLLRLCRWQGYRTLADPLVAMLHLAYLWIPTGLLLMGAAILTDRILPSAALHALTAGAMASMTLAVMTRATRGHTGRPLLADAATTAAYALILAAGILRVTAQLLPLPYMAAMQLAALAWFGAFGLFLLRYGPMLWRPRVDSKP